MARPKAEIDRQQFEALCRLNPTLKDAAAFFKVNQDTITDRCKEWGYEGFSDAREQNMVHTRLDLIRNAMQMAKKGNSALMIFCLKNLCGWADKQENTQTTTLQVVIDADDAKF